MSPRNVLWSIATVTPKLVAEHHLLEELKTLKRLHQTTNPTQNYLRDLQTNLAWLDSQSNLNWIQSNR